MKSMPLILGVALVCANLGYVKAGQDQDDRLSEQESVFLVLKEVRSSELYPWANSDCLGFFVEHKTSSTVDIDIREIHSGKCPGDPNILPVVDRFRVIRTTITVLWYDLMTGKYTGMDKANSQRNKE